ncbi:MAG TPA: hypothetical protein PLP07_09285 [Pyrinomonadaceae bacterium]|nr:hypothetical protein [Chloracidobacterium sp.]MBK9438385.1 hypothetical protein [Chloracidobacterium sp.]MBL0240730.1 hypothetical protein [Chloracidobacterium sp.]HQX56108.1 hypothetical protein [Pyrinomonadaceae bacterium]HRA41005.1 hypothetical protein [Pyrinomonadaceae bacterium]
MMKTLTIISVLFLASMTAHFSVAQDKPSDRETLIKASQILEVEPFVDKAKDFRSWAMRYVIETDDVSVTICTQMFSATMDKKNKNADELLAQYTIAMAAFKLSDPVKAKDDNAAQLAGMESMLRAYENMVKVKPKTKFAALDELVKRRDSGELKKFVEGAECGKGETAPVK